MMTTQIATPVNEIVKGQTIRVADVFLIGPLMIYAGINLANYRIDRINRPIGLALIGVGIATIIFNGKNYLENQKRLAQL